EYTHGLFFPLRCGPIPDLRVTAPSRLHGKTSAPLSPPGPPLPHLPLLQRHILPHRQHLHHRLNDDLYIQRGRLIVDIVQIEFEFFLPGDAMSSVHLCPARNTGSYAMTATVGLRDSIEVICRQGTRPDQGHVAFQNIEQLGELVEGEQSEDVTPQEPSLPGRLRGWL